MSAIRSFIAISLSEQTQQKIFEATHYLRCPQTKQVRWVNSENIHLTLKFLGDVSPSNMKFLTGILSKEASKIEPFEFTISRLGAFPHIRQPRVIWLGINAPHCLLDLQNRIERETRRLGYATEDKKFTPHLTLGRVSRNVSPEDIHSISSVLSRREISVIDTVQVKNCIFSAVI